MDEIHGNVRLWLEQHGLNMRKHANRRFLDEYKRLPNQTPLNDARVIAESEWLLRRILTPGTSDCVLPASESMKLRGRLLAKLRDRRRRKGINGMLIRIDEETARNMDLLAKAWHLTSRSHVLARLVEGTLKKPGMW